MKTNFHKYQIKAIKHLLTHQEAVLFLDMGLGKTLITLTALKTLIHTNNTRKALIVAPKTVALNTWPEEIKKWDHTSSLPYTLIAGKPQQRETALREDTPIHIINRDLIPWLCEKLEHWPYDTLVIDELSSFKDPGTQRFKQLRKQRPYINRVIGLTGTPAPNGLENLWSQYALIDQGKALGKTMSAYRDKWFRAAKWVYGRPVDYEPNLGADKEIYKAIAPITLSMQAQDYLELPSLNLTNCFIHLEGKARSAYEALRRDMITSLGETEIDAVNAAVLTGKLQQITSGAVYLQTLDGSRDTSRFSELHREKLEALAELVEAANGQPVLVAYWYRHEHDRIRKLFPKAVDVSSPEAIRAWNRARIPVGLIHPAAAGHGLNLQRGGHYLVWYTPIWNLELYQQTNARIYRQGQSQPVTISHIIARDTIDWRVSERLQTKTRTQNLLLEALKEELQI